MLQGGKLGGSRGEAGLSVLPARERDFHRWNGDPWDLGVEATMGKGLDPAGSPGGNTEQDPGPFLLAYWMARFHGLLGPAAGHGSPASVGGREGA